jgi:hypothetical protein
MVAIDATQAMLTALGPPLAAGTTALAFVIVFVVGKQDAQRAELNPSCSEAWQDSRAKRQRNSKAWWPQKIVA